MPSGSELRRLAGSAVVGDREERLRLRVSGKPLSRVRLSLAFGLSNALLTLCGLWLHMVLYRLSFAGWYIGMQAGLPGFLYVVLACQLAVPFARSLREVDA